MKNRLFKTKAKVWLYPSETAAWHFVSVPKPISEKIKKLQEGKRRRGWGAVAVNVTIGETTWKTSIFPDKKSDMYILPLKASVRKKEDIWKSETISFTIELK